MTESFLHAEGSQFAVNGETIILRGFGFGNWLNLEHFMIGLPGTESQLRVALETAYGMEKAGRFWQKYRTCYVAEEDFQFLKSLGVNAVRIPFNYHLFESDAAPYRHDPTGFIHLDRVLGLCEKYQIFGILDLHAAPGGQNPDWHSDNGVGNSLFWEYGDFQRRTIALWRMIAARYRDNPWVGAYDLLNEPVVQYPDQMVLTRFMNELIGELRKVDPNHLFFVEGDSYATDFTMFEAFDDPNLACSFHFYPFFNKEVVAATEGRPQLMEKILFQTVITDLRERLKRPIWCGETGATFSEPDRDLQETLLDEMLEILERHRISWSLWSYKDARAMGTLYPKAQSRWMEFSQKILGDWGLNRDFAASEQIVDDLLSRYPVSLGEKTRRKLVYRILADYQMILIERYPEVLKEIPFEELYTYPESFRFENCETWPALLDLVKQYTGYK